MNNANRPVYPVSPRIQSVEHSGLTKREYFAAMAMQGLCSDSAVIKAIHEEAKNRDTMPEQIISASSIRVADALLAALEETHE